MSDALSRILALPAPALLIASVLIVSLWGWLYRPVQQRLLLNPYRVRRDGALHRLLTAGWVHADVVHLALNMLALHVFADHTLRILGATRFLVLYVSAVIVAFVPTTLRYMSDPGYSTLGASGGVAAVMLSAILLDPKLKLSIALWPTPVPGAVFAVVYLAYSLWHSRGAGDDVNHDAHLSGALYGALLTYLFEPGRVERTIRHLF